MKIDIKKPNENFPIVLTYLQEVRRLTYKDYKNIKVQHGHLNERGLEAGLGEE